LVCPIVCGSQVADKIDDVRRRLRRRCFRRSIVGDRSHRQLVLASFGDGLAVTNGGGGSGSGRGRVMAGRVTSLS